MKKIKVMEYTDRWTAGGIEKYIVSLVSNLDINRFQPLVCAAQKEADLYDSELLEHGIQVQSLLTRVYEDPIMRTLNTWKLFYLFLREIKPDIIHLHLCQGVGFVYACLSKRAGVKTVITHSHNSDCGSAHRLLKLIGHRICRAFFQRNADIRLACSDLAGRWLYGNKKRFQIVRIPINIERFKFDGNKREELRRRMDIQDKCVLLNIGRMGEQKNQLYLIDLFFELHKNLKTKLIIIGQGEYEQELSKKIQEYSLEGSIELIGETSEVEKYMWLADVFVLPSLYEGNPVVLAEAQASGLCCVYSDSITGMAKINENTAAVSLKADKQVWLAKIMEVRNIQMERTRGYQNVKNQGYGVKQIIHEMQELYLGAVQ